MNSRFILGILTFIYATLCSQAALPFPVTSHADNISSNSVSLHGSLELNGRASRVGFQVRKLGVKRWVGGLTKWQKVSKGGSGNLDFATNVLKLKPDTDYEFRAVAMIGPARRNGTGVAFRTASVDPLLPPTVTTFIATNITLSNATLVALINPNNSAAQYIFEWGTSTNYGFVTTAEVLDPGVGETFVQAAIGSLSSGSTFHFRIVATNESGVSFGQNLSFETPLQPPTLTVSPSSTVNAGTDITLTAQNPNVASVTFEWFRNGVSLGAPGETASYLIEAAQPIDNGEYFVRIQSATSLAESEIVLLSVAPKTNSVPAVVSIPDEASLRAAIAQSTMVTFDCTGTIALTHPIVVRDELTLMNSNTIVLSGNDVTRLFDLRAGGSLHLQGLSLTHGLVQGTNGPNFYVPVPGFGQGGSVGGGAINMDTATLTAVECYFAANRAAGGNGGTNQAPSSPAGGDAFGGGIRAKDSHVALTNCVLTGNVAVGGAGGWQAFSTRRGPSGFSAGGAISLSNSTLIAIGCSLDTNSADSGGAIEMAFGLALFEQSSLDQNRAVSAGGGLANTGGSVLIKLCAFTENEAKLGAPSQGGAIANLAGSVTINDSQFDGNRTIGGAWSILGTGTGLLKPGESAIGGAISIMAGTASLERSSFVNNYAAGGLGSSFVGFPFGKANSGSGFGGAVFNQSTGVIVNCTFAFNTAMSGDIPAAMYSGGDSSAGFGGAVANGGGLLQIISSTIASNQVRNGTFHTNTTVGGGLYVSDGTVSLANAILAGNRADHPDWMNVFGTSVDLGSNLSSDSSANFTSPGSLNNVDPLLGLLGNYGGPTFTFPLLDGSPAINAGNALLSPATDQRGVARPQGPAPDIGSYER
ncbi:MAG TPA: choice-of-anchor Q domain-containing protein [Candidatus Acidoferrum sp.]|nr:choice-of-anchor Q domain-containing protein [Candidatus Acidoferrum sp.]